MRDFNIRETFLLPIEKKMRERECVCAGKREEKKDGEREPNFCSSASIVDDALVDADRYMMREKKVREKLIMQNATARIHVYRSERQIFTDQDISKQASKHAK